VANTKYCIGAIFLKHFSSWLVKKGVDHQRLITSPNFRQLLPKQNKIKWFEISAAIAESLGLQSQSIIQIYFFSQLHHVA
jgi:hypothetical protein